MKKLTMNLGQVIKQYRVKSGYTQMDLAEKLGYEIPQFISLMENGHSKVPVDRLGELIRLLKIPEKLVLATLVENYKKETQMLLRDGRKKPLAKKVI